MEKIRSFLAIELPRKIVDKLEEIQKGLRSSGASVKWVRPESIHLTLKFFGNIEPKMIDDISRVVTKVAAKINAFDLEVKGVGAFPDMSHPRVVWVGLESSGGTLGILHKEVGTNLEEIGFAPEGRAFTAHLTLGRVKSLKEKRQLIQEMEKFKKYELGSFRVENLILFKSELRPSGAVYTKLRTFDLTGFHASQSNLKNL
ncbi:MAG: RNA 2',3'-cyclic phosphodiesterase [Pseudomonadota bacterium]